MVSNLTWRVVSACAFVPVVLGCVWIGGWALFALVAAVVGRCTWELMRLGRGAGHRPAPGVGLGLALAYCLYVQLRGADDALPLFLAAAVALALVALLRQGVVGYTGNALFTLAGLVYVALLGTTPLLLAQRLGPAARWLLVAVFVSLWLTDAAAYAGGRLWGRRRLVPGISPGKTVAGSLCGLVGGLVPVALYPQLPDWSVAQLAALFLLVSVGAQVGDVVESALKRDLGVKDAPALIPGHGGMLDRFDSYLFGFPAAYLFTVVTKS